mgnify:CR=1|jgi:hypothetical protein
MENNKQAVNKLELLLRAMAKAQGIDPDQPDQDNQQDKQINDDKNKTNERQSTC